MSAGGPLTGSSSVTTVVSDYHDVTDYGATGDGVTNDTVAITAAAVAALAGKNRLFFPPGTYVTTAQDFTGIKEIFGVYSASKLITTGNINTTWITIGGANGTVSTYAQKVAATGVKFHDLILSRGGTDPTDGCLLKVKDSGTIGPRAKVYDCTFIGGWDNLWLAEQWLAYVRDNTFFNYRRSGIYVSNTVDVDLGDNAISGNTFASDANSVTGQDSRLAAIRVQGASGNRYLDNKFLPSGRAILYELTLTETTSPAVGQQFGIALGNFFDDSGGYNIEIHSAYGEGGAGTANVRNKIINALIVGNIMGGGQMRINGGEGGIADISVTANLFSDSQVWLDNYVDGFYFADVYGHSLSTYTKILVVDDTAKATGLSYPDGYAGVYSSLSDIEKPFFFDYVNRKMQLGDIDGYPAGQLDIRKTGTANAASISLTESNGKQILMEVIGSTNEFQSDYGTGALIVYNLSDSVLQLGVKATGVMVNPPMPSSTASPAGVLFTTANVVQRSTS